jgi:hypothetical protein
MKKKVKERKHEETKKRKGKKKRKREAVLLYSTINHSTSRFYSSLPPHITI